MREGMPRPDFKPKDPLREDVNQEVRGRKFTPGVQFSKEIGPYDSTPSGLELDTDTKKHEAGVAEDQTEKLLHNKGEKEFDGSQLEEKNDGLDLDKRPRIIGKKAA